MHKNAPLLLLFCLPVLAQSTANGPVVNSGGVVNAASYTAPVAAGSIASVFGSYPPAGLAGLSVELDGLRAPVLFTSPGQINVQVPWELAGQNPARITVTAGGLSSPPVVVEIAPFAPGIFTAGTAPQGAIVDDFYRLVDASNPALPGKAGVMIFCTGLGAVTNRPQTGSPAPGAPPSLTTTKPSVTIGGEAADVLFWGLAPGLVGGYQVNVIVPAGAPKGAAVPVVVAIGGAAANTVTMAVGQKPDERALRLMQSMMQDEKLRLVRGWYAANGGIPRGVVGWVPGVVRLGIPDLYLADGSVGVGNRVGPATMLPSSIASAAGWDLDLAYRYGQVIGAESRAYGVNVNLGGNVNLAAREPRDGRTFETKGEDPILAGKINAAHIRGVQDQHIIGGIKHFALNDQESGRNRANVLIDERAARETDLLPFEIGVRDADVQSVMCSYNLVGGLWACENPQLLTEILKGDWGFKGFVMSDWGATHSTADAARAGLDMEMPSGTWFQSLQQTIDIRQVPQSRLDDMVCRILRAMFAVGIFDFPEAMGPIDRTADEAVAQTVEEQGAVLLKNTRARLPLQASSIQSIAVIGSHADVGVMSGGGSAQVVPTGGPAMTEMSGQIVWVPSSPLKAIQAKAPGAHVVFHDGASRGEAAALAASCDVAIVFAAQWEKEGLERPTLNFWDFRSQPLAQDQDALIAEVAAANPKTIVVLETGGPVLMPWLDRVEAVLEAWFPGQRGGEAIANLLFGEVNPSGKLPMTFPKSEADLPYPAVRYPPDSTSVFPLEYAEGLLVGYKWYQAKGITPLFPFGFGLSYTTFALSGQTLADELDSATPGFRVSLDVTNTGARAGAEVVQIYAGFPAETGEPPRRLVGWQRVDLPAGETRRVTVRVDGSDSSHPLSIWDMDRHAWRAVPGDYPIYTGNSSDIDGLKLAGTLHIAAQSPPFL